MSQINNDDTRRSFLTKMTKGVVGAALFPAIVTAKDRKRNLEELVRSEQKYSANDQLQIALIGAGGMGTADTNTAITVPGIKLVAVCDLYDGRLASAKTKWGNDLTLTREYKDIINRTDIDAVIIATPDHWHKDISIAAMNSGKSVYCEKPMVHDITEGPAVIAAQNKNSKVVMQVGSQVFPVK